MAASSTYRTNGAIGALLDEYQKAVEELKHTLTPITAAQLVTIVDATTADADCKSVQAILTHVVQSGYTYAIEIRKWLGETVDYKDKSPQSSVADYQAALDEMFAYTEQLFTDYPAMELTTTNPEKKLKVRWGQVFDVEQLMQHAIVHILRHRRQIEIFLLRLH